MLDEQGIGDRRFARRIEQMLRHDRPVIVGPWTGEVGFELIYWIPFVRWVVTHVRDCRASALVVVSRGGTAPWYGDVAAPVRGRVRVLLAGRVPRAPPGGEEAAARRRLRRRLVARVSTAHAPRAAGRCCTRA